jgi:hypothetical protein
MPTSSKLVQHILLMKYPPGAQQPSPTEMKKIVVRFGAWMDGLQKQGLVAATNGLELTGKTLRGPLDEIVVTDGPFAEGKEVVGGYVLLNPCTMAQAVAAGKKCPGLDCCMLVEVRPISH